MFLWFSFSFWVFAGSLFLLIFGFFIDEVELKKQISCSLQLSNKTDEYVAFKVWTFQCLGELLKICNSLDFFFPRFIREFLFFLGVEVDVNMF